MIRSKYIVLVFVCLHIHVTAQSAHTLLREGNDNYAAGDYATAEDLYRQSREKDSDLKSNYNLGNATYQQERYEEAIDHYMKAAQKADNVQAESNAFYNLGNAYFQNQDIDEAIDAYKQSIRLNTDNKDAKYNLAMAKMIKMQAQQQQQEQESSEDGESSDSDEQQEQDQQEQEKSDQENPEDGEDGSPEEDPENQNEPQDIEQSNFDSTRLEKQSLDSIDAAKLLQIIQSEEQKVQEKLRKFSSTKKKQDKDW